MLLPSLTMTASPSTTPLLILIAGPYRSGTDDDPAKLSANLRFLESAAWPIFAAGHIPMIGEWVALPVMECIGSVVGDAASLGILTPTAERLLQHCDAVLRLPGDSTGADNDVRIATELGIPVYTSIEQIPHV